MDTKANSSFILVIACIGVVYYHIAGDDLFYIGHAGKLTIDMLIKYYKLHGLEQTLLTSFNGITAIIGIFLINSGYGLYKSSKTQSIRNFYKKRFIKIWVYGLICGVISSIIVFIVKKKIIYSYLYSLSMIYGFYEVKRELYVAQYWFLALIGFYYLIFPFLRNYINRKSFLLIALFSFFVSTLIVFNIYTNVSIYHSTISRLPEFLLGILLAKDKKLEKFFFSYDIKTLVYGLILFILGYSLFFIPFLSPISHLIFSTGAFLFGIQLSYLFVKNRTLLSFIMKLKEGTFTVYLLHLVSISFLVRISREYLVSKYDMNSGIINFILIPIYTIIFMLIFRILENKYQKWVIH